MTYNPEIHHRRSVRLRNYDYSSTGAYFVTICTSERECLLGDVVDGEMHLTDAGSCVETFWNRLPERYPEVEVDAFVVMPNHIHGIIVINGDVAGDDVVVGAIHELPLQQTRQNRRTMTLPKIIGYLKMNTAKQVNLLRDNPGVPVWQRNYYERVIRNDQELQSIRQYIENNPAQWAEDENHPNLL